MPPSVLTCQSMNSHSTIASTTTAAEIQRWKADSLDNEYLCREDVLREFFFWNLIQCQKDQLYDFYVEEEARLIKWTISWTDVARASLKETPSSQAVLNSHIVHLTFLLEQVHMFHDFIRSREDDFVEVLDAYDKCHGTKVRPTELYEFRSTHTFLNCQRLNELEAEIKDCILPLEDAINKLDGCGGRQGSLGRSLKRSSMVLFGGTREMSTKSINTRITDRTRASLTSTSDGLLPLDEISHSDLHANDQRLRNSDRRLRNNYRNLKGRLRSSFRNLFSKSHSM